MRSIVKRMKIPGFFKTKKFFVLLAVFILFFLFTPISLHQISNRMENFINDRAKEGVQTFEQQTGLKIKWGTLKFNIFIMTVKLEGVEVIPLKTSNFKKIQELHFLDGVQKVGKISATPSLYSLLFEKKIILSKLKIQKGSIYLKTLKTAFQAKKDPQDIELPIKKFIIKDVNIHLSHKEHHLRFSGLSSKILQKKGEVFHFDLFVKAFDIQEDLGFESFQSLTYQSPFNEENNNETYQLSFKGFVKKGMVSFKNIRLKNRHFQSVTEWMDIHFDSMGLKKLGIRSSGSVPSFIIRKGMHLLDEGVFLFETLLSYKLNIQYKRNKGYQGFFDIQGREVVFKSHRLKKISVKGRLLNYLFVVDGGVIETESQGMVNIKKGELFFRENPFQFNFSVKTDRLSSDFVTQAVLDLPEAPVKGNFTGSIQCHGAGRDIYIKCSIQGQSDRVILHPENQDEIMSVYGMSLNAEIEWNDRNLNFTVKGEKGGFSEIYFKGRYSEKTGQLVSSYSFFGNLYKDLKFNTPFAIKGRGEVSNGKLVIGKNKVQLEGFIQSPLLELHSYKIRNISALYKMKDNQIRFFNIKGSPGRTSYTAESFLDFEKKQLTLKLKSSFFDIEDFLSSIEENISFPVQFRGTGTAFFSIIFPWSVPEDQKFEFRGDFFNVFMDKDFFQQATFDFGIQNRQGAVRTLFFRKGRGVIQGKGSFDENYSLNLDITGQNLSLERLEWLNEILPFNQSGDVNFNMKVTGQPHQPEITSDVIISRMFFYSYPMGDSKIKLQVDKETLSFSGNVMNKIKVHQFIYPFSKNSKVSTNGLFSDLDFVKILFSKNKLQKTQDYSSKITGSFSLFKTDKAQENWTGLTKINKFFVSHSGKWIKSDKPFSVFFEEDKWSLTPTTFFHHDGRRLNISKRNNDKLFLSGESFLGLFSVFFPFIKDLKGEVKGQLLVDNNLKHIHPQGSVHIEKGSFSITPLPVFNDVKTSLIFSKNNMFIKGFTSLAGGGLVEGEGSVFYDFVSSPHLNLNLDFSSARLNIPLDFNTKGNGKIQITGKKTPYLISGQYLIDSGTITKDFSKRAMKAKYDFSFLQKEVQKQPDTFELMLNIKTIQPISVNSSLIRSSIEGDADIYGSFDSLLMTGKFALSQQSEENLVFFRGQEFKISSGSILFRKSSPENPYLNIKASTVFKENVIDLLESQQEIEREYKIFLSLKGLAKDPEFSLISEPFLNEKEIISLLTLGVGSRHFDANVAHNVTGDSSQILYSSQILASLLLEKPLNREIKNTLGLDFRITPYINTLNKPVTKITLSRNWFEKWKTSFSRTIEDAQSDVRLKYNLSNKVSLTTFWENTGAAKLEDYEEDRLGLDFEFNFDF